MSKLKFRVLSCTGEDEKYPASELNAHTPHTHGYRTKQYCTFPQELVIQLLQGECQLTQIQILSHQSCIATKIELFVGATAEKMKRLGFLNLSDNISTDFKARELKSVYVEEKAEYIKFRLHPNYINNLNIYQQVGIVAINVLGNDSKDLSSFDNPLHSTSSTTQVQPPSQRPSSKTTPMDDLAFDIHFDQETAEKIRKVHSAKAKAIEMEDYDSAKQLKTLEEKLKSAGLQIARLENQKREAVQREEYDEAKRLKLEMDKLKETLSRELYAIPLMQQLMPPPSNHNLMPPASPQKTAVVRQDFAPQSAPEPAVVPPSYSGNDLPIQAEQQQQQQQNQHHPVPQIPMEERPITARSNIGGGSGGNDEVGQYPEPDVADAEEQEGVPNPNFEGIPRAETLRDPPALPKNIDQSDASSLAGLIGDFFTRCFYSKQWQHRDAAIVKVTMDLPHYSQDDRLIVKECAKMIQVGLGDRILQVFMSAIKLLTSLIERSQHMYKEDVTPVLDPILVTLCSKLDGQQKRILDMTVDALITLASANCVNTASVVSHIMRHPQKQAAQWKRLLAKVKLLRQLVENHGLLAEHGLSMDAVMTYLNATGAFSHQKASVRDAAKELTVEVYLIEGSSVEKYLDKLRPVQLEEYQAAFESSSTKSSKPKKAKQPKKAAAPKKQPSPTPPPAAAAAQMEDDDDMLEESVDEFTCQFCLKYDKSFTEENLDVHYWQDCLMLTPCGQCDQVVEISCLNEHLLTECQFKSRNKECPRCGEAINADFYDDHVARADCPPVLPLKEASRCPLCHEDIPPGMAGWREHLLKDQCPRNPRQS